MARLPTTKRISREDLQEAPSWIEKLLSPINTFFDAVYNAINGNLTFGENISAQKRTFDFTTLSTYSSSGWNALTFTSTLKRKATGLLLMQIYEIADVYNPIESGVSVDWQDINGTIKINYIAGLGNSTRYFLRIMVI